MRAQSKLSINAKTDLYGIIGDPARHSLSPAMHNRAFQALGLNAVYLAFEVKRELLRFAFEAMRSLGIQGLNITIPHKEEALDFIDEVPEDLDRCVGAVNTVVNRNGRLFGYNTDSLGFLQALKEEFKMSPEDKTVVLLGAGGAARGVAFALAHARVGKLWICNRTLGRAKGLAEHLSKFFPDTEIQTPENLNELRKSKIDLVVNATSCGLKKEDPIPLDLKILTSRPRVYDLIYTSRSTPFLKSAESLGLANANGLGMLSAQAALSFALWIGKKEGVREVMREALDACSI